MHQEEQKRTRSIAIKDYKCELTFKGCNSILLVPMGRIKTWCGMEKGPLQTSPGMRSLSLLRIEMLCGFSGFSSFFCACVRNFLLFPLNPEEPKGVGDGDRQLEFSRTPSHLHHSRGKGSIYPGQLPSREAASTLARTTFTCRGSSVTKSAYLTLCGAATMHLGLSYRSRQDLVPEPRAYCCEQLLAKLVSATKLCSCS